jgi:histidinol-phosphate/aromatic aminotransferase/cobyric acid decarboxylase-like protein
VNVVAEQAAYAALTDDLGWVAEHVTEAVANRRRFEQALSAIGGFRVVPSCGNFVFAHTARASAGIVASLCARGIGVRGYPDGIRITIGPWPLMVQCLDALAAV